MKKKHLLLTVFIALLGCFFLCKMNGGSLSDHRKYPVQYVSDSTSFTLKKGDILVRPNWSWLPGSFPVNGGRKFGHVAVVIEDMTGKTIDEVLSKTTLIEALLYDQATRKFLFRREDQIREGKASVAFGNRFKGARYRLRANLSGDETEAIIRFLNNQLDGGYDILSRKKQYPSDAEKQKNLQSLKQDGWHCATLTWEAFYLAAGLDIDSNQGWSVYPSDIIASSNFDLPGGRIRF